ncbi:RNA polymerase sigma factor [Capsulimonas corticalis]|uniref:RNA polymerase sigma factor n=1 Tax=Capsulimonas corticalis TaxID=2219043 RepID=A0A402CRC6_9BACT|nr:sigma-70 family RNA polymerase sigma factor [Capsulimonas corticalis]BDI28049.1 RNA polymerase sigma factor [Capsulimonas corticalis]
MFLALIMALPPGETGAAGESDRALVEAAKRGSGDAFAALHSRYYARIYRLAYLKTNNASDAEDVASETFLRALSSLPRFHFKAGMPQDASLYPWLHRIATNLIVDSCRQRPPSGTVSLDAPLVEGMRDLLADRTPARGEANLSPQEVVERHEVQQLVRAAIATLPADQSEVLIYRFLGDLSLKEIAPLMERSESAVKSLLHRAVVALRGEISRRLDSVERLETGREEARRRVSGVMQHVGRSTGETH